jgi:hypothetical protein
VPVYQPALKERPIEPAVGPQGSVNLSGEANPVDHRAPNGRRPEAVGLGRSPISQLCRRRCIRLQTGSARPRPAGEHRVPARHQIVVVHARIGTFDGVTELLAVAGASPRIRRQYSQDGGYAEWHAFEVSGVSGMLLVNALAVSPSR